jgi:hypothetical protein
MTGIALVRRATPPHPARAHAPRDEPRLEPEHVEEVWDAELVGDLPSPGWIAVPALASYQVAGFASVASRIDLRA